MTLTIETSRDARGRRRRLIVFLALCSVGCASDCDSGGASVSDNGELGNGEFRYACGGVNDPICATDTLAFPDCIVVGGRFAMSYELRDQTARNGGWNAGAIAVEAGSDRYIAHRGELFEALRPGRAAMLAREGDYILDMLHLELTTASSLRLENQGSIDIETLRVDVGETQLVAVHPDATGCVRLGGAIEVRVTNGDPSIARMDASDGLEITGVAPGMTTFDIAAGELERQLTVIVEGISGTTGGSGSTTGGADFDTGASETAGTSTDATSTGGTSDPTTGTTGDVATTGTGTAGESMGA